MLGTADTPFTNHEQAEFYRFLKRKVVSSFVPETVWAKLNPAKAEVILSLNRQHDSKDPTSNRRVDKHNVERLSQDMKEGRYVTTHQGLAFDTNGILADGQHRCEAICKSGVEITIPITFGLPVAAASVIDTQKSRGPGEALRRNGFTSPMGILSFSGAARSMMFGHNMTERRTTNTELTAFCRRHYDALQFATSLFTRGGRGIRSSAFVGMVARAYYHVDHNKLREFVGQIYGDTPTDRADPSFKFREYLESNPGGSGAARRSIYRRGENAIRLFLEGRKIHRLFESGDELFPLPEEKAAANN